MVMIPHDETKRLIMKVAFRNILWSKKKNDVRCWDLSLEFIL